MPVQLNHTIVSAGDSRASAAFMAEILGLAAPMPFGPFMMVETDNGVSLDFIDADGAVTPQHYAFLVSDEEFDQIFGRIQERGLIYSADPGGNEVGRINTHDGGRGVYWDDPSGNRLEIITKPYGSGA